MATSETCGAPTEAELQRWCGSLYVTHGLESTCGLLMFIFFSIVAVKLHARSHLRSPAMAFIRFLMFHFYILWDEFVTTIYTVGQMNRLKLEARLRFCGNVDKMTNATSCALALLGITRWLSIGNVNGMRYIGYAMTCPLMQLELVVMLAPIIPCYQLAAFSSFAITFMTLTMGYVASLLWMPVWEGDLIVFLQTMDVADLQPTMKLWVVMPALCGITVLFCGLLPYYMLMYTCAGGNRNEDLPQEYRYLVCIVWCTWILFPCWWFLSWEGNGVITDTKLNEIGFTIFNMAAKGLFTLQGFRVGELNDERVALRRGNAPSNSNRRKSNGNNRKGDNNSEKPELKASQSNWSSEGEYCPPILSRASSRQLEASKFVKVLRHYDNGIEEETEQSEAPSSDSEGEDEQQLKRTAQANYSCSPPSAHYAAPNNYRCQIPTAGQSGNKGQRNGRM